MRFPDILFRDKNGKIIIVQWPNLPLATYFICTVVAEFVNADVRPVFQTISFGALFVFAWLELFQGVNLFRRLLGLIVLFLIVSSRIYFSKVS